MTEREMFLYELGGRGFSFQDNSYSEFGFDDEILNMVWEMWCASANREGYKIVPLEPTEEMIDAYEKHSIAPIGALSKHGYKAMINAID